MKRIVAMLLAVAAVVCCAGCGAGGGGATTTMTEEDFYVYENGEVVYNPITDDAVVPVHGFTDTEETKRGIHIGSTLEDLEKAYAGEAVAWTWAPEDAKGPYDYTFVRLGQDDLKKEKINRITLECFWDLQGNLRIVDDEEIRIADPDKGDFIWIHLIFDDNAATGKIKFISVMLGKKEQYMDDYVSPS